MKQHFIACLLTCLLLTPGIIQAQRSDETASGLQFGLNFGYYSPSKYTANFYNGSAGNLNNANWVVSNKYLYQQIYDTLLATDTVLLSGLPSNMHYKISMMPGIYAQYTLNKQYAICISINYMKLVAQDAITFEVDPKTYNTNPDLRMFTIIGQEQRVYIDLGIKRFFKISDKTELFAIGGLNMNDTKVIKSSFFVGKTEYSMINTYGNVNYVPNSNIQSFNITEGGIGFGLYLSGGATFHFGNITFEPGFNAHYINVHLNGYEKFSPGGGLYIRFILNNLFSTD